MRIEELVLKGFGKWQDASFRFAPGINLFQAPNESGKSTMLQGIFAALYGMKRDYVKSARYLPEYEKYRPWQQAPYETIITYELAGKTYRLHRQLAKEREEARLFLDPEWTELTDIYMEDRRKERNFIEQHTGLTRSLFTDLTWIRREPLQAAEHLIPTFATSDEANPAAQQIVAELDRELALIGKKERAENTLLGKAATRAAQKEQEKENAQAAWRTISQLTLKMAEAKEECQQLEQRRGRLQQQLERVAEHQKAWQERWQQSHKPIIDQDWEWWEQTATSSAEQAIHHKARHEFAQLAMPITQRDPQGDDQARALQQDYERAIQLRKQREERHIRLATLAVSALSTSSRRSTTARTKNLAKRRRGAALMWGGAGVLTLTGIIGFSTGYPVLGGIVLALAVLLFGLGVLLLRAKGSAVTPGQVAEQDSVQEGQRLQEEIAAIEAQWQTILQRWDAVDWDTFLERREELLRSTRDQQTEQIHSEIAITKQQNEIASRWGEALRACLDQENSEREAQQGKWQNDLVQLDERLQALREQIARGNGEMAVHENVSLSRASDEYEEAQAALRQLYQKRDALQLAKETLQEALGEWKRDRTPAVNQQASQVIAHITAGAYEDVRLDPRDSFAVRLLAPTGHRVLEQDQCSTGTIDQLYLAQRLSLVHHASEGTEPLPLFFDDHFVHYDEERLRRTLEYIAMLAQEQQVFLFTCHEREQRILEPLLRQGNRHVVHKIG